MNNNIIFTNVYLYVNKVKKIYNVYKYLNFLIIMNKKNPILKYKKNMNKFIFCVLTALTPFLCNATVENIPYKYIECFDTIDPDFYLQNLISIDGHLYKIVMLEHHENCYCYY